MIPTIIPVVRCNDNNADSIVACYRSVFPDMQIIEQNPMLSTIEIYGTRISLLNGGVHEPLNPSISFSLWIKDITLTKKIRDQLVVGGTVLMEYQSYDRSPGYGWCNDQFGISRQVMYDDREATHDHALIPSLMYTQDMAGQAESAMKSYINLFPDSQIDFIWRYEAGGVDQEGTIAHGEFTLHGQQFIAMDSAQEHKFVFNDALSLMIVCDGQAEVDGYRDLLLADGGSVQQCGRLRDKYGVRWQIVPIQLQKLLADPDKASYAMESMLKMKKILIADLEA